MTEVRNLGLDGALVIFGDRLSEPVSRAALAFAAAVDASDLKGLREAAPTLTSVYVGFDPLVTNFSEVSAALEPMLAARDWRQAARPGGGRNWVIPVCFDGAQLSEVAEIVGRTVREAVAEVCAAELRVLMLGFAPGQPYLGELPEHWKLPRQGGLTEAVPPGAVVTAVRQVTMFDRASPTGWRWIGRMAFRMFRHEAEDPFALRPGDGVRFRAVSAEELARMREDRSANGGAETR